MKSSRSLFQSLLSISTSSRQGEVLCPPELGISCPLRTLKPSKARAGLSAGLRLSPPPSLAPIRFPSQSPGRHHQRIFRPLRSRQLSIFERLFECFATTHRNVWISKRNTGKRATTSTVLSVSASRSLPSQRSPPTIPAPTDRFQRQGHQIAFEKSKSCYNIPRPTILVLLEGYNIQCWHTRHRPTQGCFSGR